MDCKIDAETGKTLGVDCRYRVVLTVPKTAPYQTFMRNFTNLDEYFMFNPNACYVKHSNGTFVEELQNLTMGNLTNYVYYCNTSHLSEFMVGVNVSRKLEYYKPRGDLDD
jgi:hypothetical protein